VDGYSRLLVHWDLRFGRAIDAASARHIQFSLDFEF